MEIIILFLIFIGLAEISSHLSKANKLKEKELHENNLTENKD